MHPMKDQSKGQPGCCLLILTVFVLALPAIVVAQDPQCTSPIWSDEFGSNGAPDDAVWSYDLGNNGWGNSEIQEYTDDANNVKVENGNLIITAQKTQNGFTSARIRTQDKLTLKYGTLEASIKVPNLANGLWPAFWTLGNNFPEVGWPACGELDVMEMGSAGAINEGVVNSRVGSTAHWENNDSYAGYGLSYDDPTDVAGDDDFHLFRMEWTPTEISTYVDNNWIWTIDIRPEQCTDCTEFHQPHFIILNMAVGGSYTGRYGTGDITAPFPAAMEVDWVRVCRIADTVMGGTSIDGGGPSETCGDGTCEAGEDCSTCAIDCGACPSPTPIPAPSPTPGPTCPTDPPLPKGSTCTDNCECESNRCKGGAGNKSCK